jgi:hypothetical protein
VKVIQYTYVGCFSYLTEKRLSDSLESFIRFSKGYFLCDPLSTYRHYLLNLLEVRRKAQSWQSVGSAFIGQAGNETHL